MAAVTGALLIGSCLTPAFAQGVSIGGISVGIGGNSSGGTTVGATVGGVAGGVNGSVSIGGGGGNVATGTVTTGNPATSTTVSIGNTSGPLATVDSDGQNTDAAVNLGAILGDLGSTVPGDGTAPGDGTTPGDGNSDNGVGNGGDLASAFGALGAGEQQALKVKCQDVLARPGSFKPKLVTLCRMIASL
jgi:hypothetical protein